MSASVIRLPANTPAPASTASKRINVVPAEDWGESRPHVARPEDLQSHITRLTRVGLLSAAQEVRLAKRVAQGDKLARERLVECNMRLVVSIAKSYRASGIPFEDLVQEGAIGLMTAVERFDPNRGYRFSTYATQWIRQAIGRAVDNKAKSIRLPAHVSESLRKIDRVRSDMRRESGEEPSHEQLGQRLGLTTRKVSALLSTTQDPISLDAPVGDEDRTTLGALLHDRTTPNPQDEVITQEMREQVQGMLKVLDERERAIVCKRYGFDGEETYVLQQIGEQMGISRERVRQIEAQALRKLRHMARKYQLREYIQGC